MDKINLDGKMFSAALVVPEPAFTVGPVRITMDGMEFNGEKVTDSGEAYSLLTSAMRNLAPEITRRVAIEDAARAVQKVAFEPGFDARTANRCVREVLALKEECDAALRAAPAATDEVLTEAEKNRRARAMLDNVMLAPPAAEPAQGVPRVRGNDDLTDERTLRFAKFLVNRGIDLPDHACAECAPLSDMLVDGFQCAYHEAVALLATKKEQANG